MNDKSHVGMGHFVCPVCHVKHDEVVLLDKRLKNTLTRDMFMGYGLCPTHTAMSEEYVALVGVDEGSSTFTGEMAHVRWEFAEKFFGKPMSKKYPFVWAESTVITKLKELI